MGINIYPSITTIFDNHQQMIRDINNFGITEACFFPTSVNPKFRPQLYRNLENSCLKYIPLVHIKSDFTVDEIEYFQNRWHTKYFNIHTQNQYPLDHNLSSKKDVILMENASIAFDENEPGNWGGLCLDIAHYEYAKNFWPKLFISYQKGLASYPVKATHVGSFHPNPQETNHLYKHLSEFDYLKQYFYLFPEICALELENTIPEQLAAKKYIENLIQMDS